CNAASTAPPPSAWGLFPCRRRYTPQSCPHEYDRAHPRPSAGADDHCCFGGREIPWYRSSQRDRRYPVPNPHLRYGHPVAYAIPCAANPAAAKSFCMEKKKLDYFRKRLESRQQDLRRMVSRTQQDGRTVDEDSAQDIADRAASSYTKEFLFHQSNNDRQLLQMVEGALDR